jgi:hypothetical protein
VYKVTTPGAKSTSRALPGRAGGREVGVDDERSIAADGDALVSDAFITGAERLAFRSVPR